MMFPLRWIALAALVVLLCIPSAPACTFCAGSATSQQTLREHFAAAKFVAYGKLSNPKVEPNGLTGTTDFAPLQVLKSHEPFDKRGLLTLPKYLPVIGKTPPEFLLFATDRDGTPDPLHGVPATLAVSEYVAGLGKLEAKEQATKLAFFFRYLDAADGTVAADAFLEFAKASDAEITAAKPQFQPEKLRKLLVHPDTPIGRLGVFAMMLGLCGNAEDRTILDSLLKEQPLSPRIQENLGGYLAGLTMLDTNLGWKRISEITQDAKRGYSDRLAAIGTVRYFQVTRPVEARPQVLACYRNLLRQPDLADMAIEDLRRWGYWDLTPEVLKSYGQPGFTSRLVKRAIVQYAMSAPTPEAKSFVSTLRVQDPKFVESVEELLKLQDPVKKP